MENKSSTQAGKLQDVAFKVFALVGFLSSIVTIIAWANDSSASLTAKITEKTIEVPQSLALSKLTDERFSLDSALKDLSNKYCAPTEVGYDGKQSKNYNYNQETCSKQQLLHDVFRKISQSDGKPLLAYDISLVNDGTESASNIKIRSAFNVSATGQDSDGNVVKINTIQDGRSFSIPDLNPRETISVRLVSSTAAPLKFEEKPLIPVITFSGGKANIQEFLYISGRYSGVINFLDDMPLILQIFSIAAGSFLITIVWLIPLGYISNLADGKSKEETSKV